MFTCNNINLLTFSYYLKYFLIFNVIVLPFIYIYLNFIHIIKRKINLNKWYLKRRLKTIYYILTILLLSLITHNMLIKNNNACYLIATPEIYNQYRNSYIFLKNKEIDSDLKNSYLENILINKDNSTVTNMVYKQAKILTSENSEVSENNNQEEVNYIDENNFLHESDLNMQNSVFVIDGVFYYPNYSYTNSATYSGMSCSSNPISDGYNNPYGYNNYFYARLNTFIEDAKKNGFIISMSNQGCRDYNTQVYYYNTMASGRAAAPGHSLHGFGIASDLEFYQSDGSVCPYYRNDNTCPSMGWAHNNAYKYGLVFPLLNASYKEDWHIEPLNKAKY